MSPPHLSSNIPFRQVHLDFHTNENIPGIGSAFDKASWQQTLKEGHVNSVTLFGMCHHGWCYYPTGIGERHPNLEFDLLGEQIEACHELGIRTPVYITFGWNERYAALHPEALIYPPAEKAAHFDLLRPKWKQLAFDAAYIDFIESITGEILDTYNADGIFYDIVGIFDDISLQVQRGIRAAGMDPLSPADRYRFLHSRQQQFFSRMKGFIHGKKPGISIFFNGGHIQKGDHSFLNYVTHLEMESLPTGGWGYDHFPLSAKYAITLKDVEFVGMTGKFHTTWAEFGGFKHPNALRYECAAMLAYGAKCCIGDQLHPNGQPNKDTYNRIGAAYKEVKAKEPWCDGVQSCAEVAILSEETLPRENTGGDHFGGRSFAVDTGVSRMLLERQILFDLVDFDSDWSSYRILILPDIIRLDEQAADKVQAFLDKAGKVMLTGCSGLKMDSDEYALSGIGAYHGTADFEAEYLQAEPVLLERDPDRLIASPFVVRGENPLIQPAPESEILAKRIEPYFKRTTGQFCSHQHAPEGKESQYPGAFINGERNILVVPEKVFTYYYEKSPVLVRDTTIAALSVLSAEPFSVETNLQSAGRINLLHQPAEKRFVLHLLYATPMKRGNRAIPKWGVDSIEVIEDIPVIADVKVGVKLPQAISSVTLVPSMESLQFQKKEDGRIEFTLPRLECHQIIELK